MTSSTDRTRGIAPRSRRIRTSGSCGRAGFTLVEVIVVLAVLGILLGTATPLVSALIDQEREQTVREELAAIGQALEEYYYDRARFPPSLSDLSFRGVYLLAGVDGTGVKDGWGGNVEYIYRVDANPDACVVRSRGRNGVDDGGAGDDLAVSVQGSAAGYRKTRERMRIMIEVLANFLESGGTLTGTWSTDRANMGLGSVYANDGFGTAFRLDPKTYVLRSAGPDRTFETADDLTS